jgi:hypothetical protein
MTDRLAELEAQATALAAEIAALKASTAPAPPHPPRDERLAGVTVTGNIIQRAVGAQSDV